MSFIDDAAHRAIGWALHRRALVRAPIWLYRSGLGGLLGSRLLMLEHIGRRTGVPRYVVLEVLTRPDADTYVVASGFGTRAQWFRNVLAEPRVRVWSGGRRDAPATATVLPTPQADEVLQGYAARHPRAWEALTPTLEQALGQPITTHDTALPLVEVRVRG
ncbi:nitroreductase family deazaflavin-dependent oxidoreductase [Mycobacterium sp. PS03-16]|uniref:nitroreductase family deazaflavin-dependent oxidoreductase n=1 Tax=Mycobacterium sp. PS03-16 TaxID=2559611 RepID=UPI0010739F39|nr:nitroreductase family deazaflavin-dependent oxidoreductase [Mycobacterium sp. PS03-16]TFV61450.1 nitroreductase family deazaflavin-dependent oxidoreductase [Mycobacterium sp. PS03-16]